MIVDVLAYSAVFGAKSGDPLIGRVDGAVQQVAVSEHDLQNGKHLPLGLGRRIDRFCSLALLTTEEIILALPRDLDLARAGVFVGNVYAGWSYGEPQLANLVESGPAAIHAYLATAWFPAAAQGEVTIHHGWKGASKTFSGSGSAIAEAFLAAALNLHFDRLDVALVVAAESCLSDFLCWGAGLRSKERLIVEGAASCLIARPGRALSPMVSLDVTIQGSPGKFAADLDRQPAAIAHLEDFHRRVDALSQRASDRATLPLSGCRSLQLRLANRTP